MLGPADPRPLVRCLAALCLGLAVLGLVAAGGVQAGEHRAVRHLPARSVPSNPPGPAALPVAASPPTSSAPAITAAGLPLAHEVMQLQAPGQRGTREVQVYRPAGPDQATIPVVYFLHGLPGEASDVSALVPAMEAWLRSGGRPFVLVGPDGNGEHHPDTEWANATDGSDQLETFVSSNVIQAVEGAHRRTPSRRSIIGFSMGAYAAVNLAERHPDLYGQVASISGYFHVDDPHGVFANQQAAAANSPDLHVDRLAGHPVLLGWALDEPEALIDGESERITPLLAQARVPTAKLTALGSHDYDLVRRLAPSMVGFLAQSWT